MDNGRHGQELLDDLSARIKDGQNVSKPMFKDVEKAIGGTFYW